MRLINKDRRFSSHGHNRGGSSNVMTQPNLGPELASKLGWAWLLLSVAIR
jgi:hypothetical protein